MYDELHVQSSVQMKPRMTVVGLFLQEKALLKLLFLLLWFLFLLYSFFVLQDGVFSLSDKEIQMLVEAKAIPAHQLEKFLKDPSRAVKIRYLIFTTFRDCFC